MLPRFVPIDLRRFRSMRDEDAEEKGSGDEANGGVWHAKRTPCRAAFFADSSQRSISLLAEQPHNRLARHPSSIPVRAFRKALTDDGGTFVTVAVVITARQKLICRRCPFDQGWFVESSRPHTPNMNSTTLSFPTTDPSYLLLFRGPDWDQGIARAKRP